MFIIQCKCGHQDTESDFVSVPCPNCGQMVNSQYVAHEMMVSTKTYDRVRRTEVTHGTTQTKAG